MKLWRQHKQRFELRLKVLQVDVEWRLWHLMEFSQRISTPNRCLIELMKCRGDKVETKDKKNEIPWFGKSQAFNYELIAYALTFT